MQSEELELRSANYLWTHYQVNFLEDWVTMQPVKSLHAADVVNLGEAFRNAHVNESDQPLWDANSCNLGDKCLHGKFLL